LAEAERAFEQGESDDNGALSSDVKGEMGVNVNMPDEIKGDAIWGTSRGMSRDVVLDSSSEIIGDMARDTCGEVSENMGRETRREIGGDGQSYDSKSDTYIKESISVDAACSGNPGPMEYQGVYTATGEQVFHYGPVEHGTNNIGEFLAIVHALALMKQKGESMPIYSDSLTAIKWVKQKRVNTTIEKNEQTAHIWNLIERATHWLEENMYENEIWKWNTEKWGESKPDYGRK